MSNLICKYNVRSSAIFVTFLIFTKILLAASPFLDKHSQGQSVEMDTNASLAEKGKKLEGKVGPYKGRNVFFVNGKPMAPIMYSSTEQGRKTWADPTKKSIEEFTAQDYDIIQTDMWFKYSLNSDGSFDINGIRKQLAGILKINPDAKLVVRINVSAPKWWLKQNPNEICKVTNDSTNKKLFREKMGTNGYGWPPNDNNKNIFSGNTAESLASEKYKEFAYKYLKLFLQELEKTPEGDRIIGLHIGGGVYGEWHYYGIYDEPDASEPMRKKFIAFATEKYTTIDRINTVWKTNFKNTTEITVPSYSRRYLKTDGDFRDPKRDMYVIDYYECQQKTVGQLVNGLAKLTKETWSRPVITGVFYGYFYGQWTVGSQSSQADIQTIFKSPYIDYFAGPFASRSMYGSGISRSLAKSVSLNGKIWITENDAATYLGSSGSGDEKFPDIPKDEHQSVARMRRNYMYSITENGGQWWYDFGPKSQGGGWWSTSGMLREAKQLLALSNRFLEQSYEKKSDILVVFDMHSFNYVRPAKVDKLTFKITEEMSDLLLGTGTSFDKIFLMDLKLVDLSKYKLVIFGNIFALSNEDRAYIKNKVMKDGRHMIFISGAGYSNAHRNDPSLISDLTGINIQKSNAIEPKMNVTLDGQEFTIQAPGVSSFFKVDDPGAKSIGIYENGEIGAAVKTVNGCSVYYFGTPLGSNLSFYKILLEQSGCRVFVQNTADQDYVSVGGGIIGIYSVKGGEKIINPLNGRIIKAVMRPFSTFFFDLQTGKNLTEN